MRAGGELAVKSRLGAIVSEQTAKISVAVDESGLAMGPWCE
jgi:hypothetical protein